MILLPFLLQWSLGGFVESGSVAFWAFFAPLAALVFYGPRPAIAWFVAFLALVALSAAIDGVLPEPAKSIPSWLVVGFFALNIFGPSITTFALLEHFVRARDRAHWLLSAEQERSETLLLSIFPQAIAERLKLSRTVIAERSDEVSVLFADSSASHRSRNGSRRRRSWFSWTRSSRRSTSSSNATGSRRSRRSATATSPWPGFRRHAPTTPRRPRALALAMRQALPSYPSRPA